MTTTSAPSWDSNTINYLKVWATSTIVSAIAYGGVLSLALSYIPLLLKTSNDLSRRMHGFLVLYVACMVAIGTTYMISTVIALTTGMFLPVELDAYSYFLPNGALGGTCIILASWGADAFMLWRCAMLYQGISRFRWIALVALLVFLALISFGSGLIFLTTTRFGQLAFTVVLMGITIILNLITAFLITLRIIYYQRYIKKMVGLSPNSPYNMVIAICLESSALIVVISFIFLFMSFVAGYYVMIPMQLLVHVYVLSPLLIVYRVARGRAVTARPSESGPAISALRFEYQPQRASNDEV